MNNLLLSFIAQALDTEPPGGLFDFNATLPLMALQFLGLTVILNLLFYRPISQILNEREDYIRNSLTTASAYLVKADELTNQYEYELAESRKNAQNIIKTAQQEAQTLVSNKIKEAQKETDKLLDGAYQQLNIQKEKALQSLEIEVDRLSNEIKVKLLGS
uniref:ATP synthase subunit b', chloroplastic n=1 Tax=Dasya naccarioides TaxID=2007180 RepID=A0A1Z1MH32_9FLOR|nr:ATP synthase CF0 subunit II [Dasya naccarioides]ARW65172.1 ATP synthase CF0 subunit II [Dasya naccarioides]